MDVMDPSIAQHQQETLESMLVCTKPQDDQKKPRLQPEHALKCPRCDSTNTKFCYYNNYSLTQPRYFCKACRRYWTKGGTLRNVPVGGGCRKNKRSSLSSAAKMRTGSGQDGQSMSSSHSSPVSGLGYDSGDLNLAFARLQKQNEMGFDGQDLSVMGGGGSANNTLHGLFGNFSEGGFQNQGLYYGYGGLGSGHDQQMGMIGYEQDHGMMRDATGAVKQEYCGGRDGDQQRVLWGFPWQIGGNENLGVDFENSGRESWNGIGATWHGLINSPLM